MGKMDAPLAVFDFDGTIIPGDSFLPFMRYLVGPYRYYQGILYLLPWLGGYALGQIGNREIKERVISYFLKGYSFKEIEEKGRQYAVEVLTRRERPDMLEKMEWHQDEKHRLLLASASLMVYLRPWAEKRGFHGVCGAELEIDEKGMITGKIRGNNGFGQEKLEAVAAWLNGKKPPLTYAYGDSQGDKELLEWADIKIFKGQELSESRAS